MKASDFKNHIDECVVKPVGEVTMIVIEQKQLGVGHSTVGKAGCVYVRSFHVAVGTLGMGYSQLSRTCVGPIPRATSLVITTYYTWRNARVCDRGSTNFGPLDVRSRQTSHVHSRRAICHGF